MLRKSLAAAALLAGTAFLAQTAQAAPGYVTETTPMHAGPDTDYPTVRVIHDGREVFVHGCLDDWSWCDVSFHADRGWVSGGDLAVDYQGRRAGLASIAALVGIGVLAFDFDDYWGRYYHGRPFYSHRDHWQSFSTEHHRDNWGPRPGHGVGHPEGGRPEAARGGFHADEHGRPAAQQNRQVQQEHRQAPENHATGPEGPRGMAPARTEGRPEHQPNRPAAPAERQQPMPVHQEAPQAARPAAPMHQAAPEHPAAAQPQHGGHGDDKKKDEH